MHFVEVLSAADGVQKKVKWKGEGKRKEKCLHLL